MQLGASKPHYATPIHECGEVLLPIPESFLCLHPHPYAVLGACYGAANPFSLRSGVIQRLAIAQEHLQGICSGWRVLVFDAYRPVGVQQFMVDYTFAQLLGDRGWQIEELTPRQRAETYQRVFEFWAPPSLDPNTPPPHSTGAAIDVTLADAEGRAVEMGSDIDEVSPRSHPNFFESASDEPGRTYRRHRQLLRSCFLQAGFLQHPNEWWHFSFGDQMWAWQKNQHEGTQEAARYGRV